MEGEMVPTRGGGNPGCCSLSRFSHGSGPGHGIAHGSIHPRMPVPRPRVRARLCWLRPRAQGLRRQPVPHSLGVRAPSLHEPPPSPQRMLAQLLSQMRPTSTTTPLPPLRGALLLALPPTRLLHHGLCSPRLTLRAFLTVVARHSDRPQPRRAATGHCGGLRHLGVWFLAGSTLFLLPHCDLRQKGPRATMPLRMPISPGQPTLPRTFGRLLIFP